MRVLFISKEGDGLSVGCHLAKEGHHVDYWIKEPRFARAGRGIVERPTSWRSVLGHADLIISDMVGFGHKEVLFKRLGKPTISVNKMMDVLELDRKRGMQLFKSFDIQLPETKAFGSMAEAKKYIQESEWENGFVLKPDGNKATSKTMVIKEPERLDYCTEHQPPGSLIVQRIIDGVEVSTEGWFNGRDFVRPFNHTFEEKRFLAGGLGQNTGCMGNVVLSAQSNKLTKGTVERLAPFLRDINYRGPVDINCIVNESGAYALEATSRLGYDAIEAMLEGLREPAIDLFFEVALGIKKEMKITKDPMIAVRLSIPPWPVDKPKEDEYGEPVLGLSEGVLRHVFLTDIYKEGTSYFTAGGDGVLLKATATGRDVREARNRAYRTLDSIKVNSKQFRQDIGERVDKDVARLKGWGWL